MKRAPLLVAALLASPAVSSAAPPSPPAAMMGDANAVLVAADERASAFKDQSYSAAMQIHKGGKLRKTLEFDMVMRGLEQQLIVFKAPGDVAGMKILMQDKDTLYVYSPEFKKVRRIAAHMQNQGFLGSEFTYEDMVQTKLSGTFDAKLGGRSGKLTTLVLTPKAGAKSTYPKVEAVIDAAKGGITTLRYFDGAGKLVREQLREGWKKAKGQLVPMRITMKNHKTGNHTVIQLSNLRVNQGVPDSKFSRRTLMRG